MFVFSFVTSYFPALTDFEPINVYNALFFDERVAPTVMRVGELIPRASVFDLTQHGYPLVYGGLAAVTLLAALAAWRGALRPAGLGAE